MGNSRTVCKKCHHVTDNTLWYHYHDKKGKILNFLNDFSWKIKWPRPPVDLRFVIRIGCLFRKKLFINFHWSFRTAKSRWLMLPYWCVLPWSYYTRMYHCITISYQVNARPKQICGLTFTPYDEAEPDATNLTDVVCANATALQHQFWNKQYLNLPIAGLAAATILEIFV